jgi:hypothetical protein
MNYNQVFHSGFSLFSTLFKIVKIIKFKSQRKKVNEYYTKKLNKINLKRENSLSITKGNSTIDETKNFEENIEDLRKEYQIHIRNLYNSVWLIDYFTNLNFEKIIFQPFGQKDDYYIKKGYYSKFNLKQTIIQNLEINEQYKKKYKQKKEKEKKLVDEQSVLNNNKLEIPFKLNNIIKKKIKKKLEFKNKNIVTIYKDLLNESKNSMIKNPSEDDLINNYKKQYKKNSKIKRKDLRINNMNSNYMNNKFSNTHRLKVFNKNSVNCFRKNSQEKLSNNEINNLNKINSGLKLPENYVKIVNHCKLIPDFGKSNSLLSKYFLGNSIKRKKSYNSMNQSDEGNHKKYLSMSKSNYKISSKSNSQNKTSEN